VQRRHITVHADGRVNTRVRINARLRSQFDFRRFPFDQQTLVIHAESFTWNTDVVRLVHSDVQSTVDNIFELPEWQVTGVRETLTDVVRARDGSPYARFTLEIDIQRRTGFYLWKVIIPLLTLVTVSWVVFWMSSESLARRAGVSMTGLLTVVAYQFIVSEWLPRIAYLTVMDKLTLLSFISIAATMVVNFAVHVERWVERGWVRRIDAVSRWAFPLLYVAALLLITRSNFA
jgi:hypothetical protein